MANIRAHRWIQREPSTCCMNSLGEVGGGGEDWIIEHWYAQEDARRFQQVEGVLRLNIQHGGGESSQKQSSDQPFTPNSEPDATSNNPKNPALMKFVLGHAFRGSVWVPLTFTPVGVMLHPNCKACRLLRTLLNVRRLEPHTPVTSITLNSITIPFSSWALRHPSQHKHVRTLIRVINSV